MNARWIRMTGIAVLFAAVSLASAAPAPQNVFPPDPLLFVAVRDADGLRRDFPLTPMAQLWADPALKPFKDALAKTETELRTAAEQAPPEARRGLTAVAIAAGMIRQAAADLEDLSAALYIRMEEGQKEPKGDLCLKAQIRGETLEMLRGTVFTQGLGEEGIPEGWSHLDKEVQKGFDRGGLKLEELPNGAVLIDPAKKDAPAAALSGGLLICSTNRQWVRDLAAGKPIANGVDPAAQALGEKADHPGIILVQNMTEIWEILDNLEKRLQQASAGEESASRPAAFSQRRAEELGKLRMVRELLRRTGCEGLQSLAVRHWWGQDGFRSRCEWTFKGQPQGLINTGPNRPFQVGQWAPSGLTSAGEFYWRPGGEIWAEVRETVQAVGGVSLCAMVDSLLGNVKARTGIDLEKDVINNVSGHCFHCSARWEPSAAASAPAMALGPQLPPVYAGIEAADPQALASTLERAIALLPLKWQVTTQSCQSEGVAYKTFGAALFPFIQPAFGVVDGAFLIATSGAAFEAAAKAHAAGGTPESKAALDKALKDAGFPSQGLSLKYSDPREGLRAFQQACATFGPFLPIGIMAVGQNAKTPKEQEAVRLLGSAAGNLTLAVSQTDVAALCAHLFPRVAVSHGEGNKVVEESRSALDEDLAGGAMAAGIAMAVVQAARKDAERKKMAAQKGSGPGGPLEKTPAPPLVPKRPSPPAPPKGI